MNFVRIGYEIDSWMHLHIIDVFECIDAELYKS